MFSSLRVCYPQTKRHVLPSSSSLVMSTIIKHKVHAHCSLHREGGEANHGTAKLLAEAMDSPSLGLLALILGCPVVASERSRLSST